VCDEIYLLNVVKASWERHSVPQRREFLCPASAVVANDNEKY